MHKLTHYINKELFIAIIILTLLVLYGVYMSTPFGVTIQNILIIATIIGSIPLTIEIAVSMWHKEFGVDLIALVAIVSSLFIGEYVAASLILLMLSGGESLETYAENKAKNSLEKLLKNKPAVAHIDRNGAIIDVAILEIQKGDKILVKQNEIIPIDGVIVEGNSIIDESMITGEPIPKDIAPGSKVLSGSVNMQNIITVETTSTHDQSTFQTIIRLVDEAESNKAPTVRLADRYSVVFTFITLAIALGAMFLSPKLAVAVLVVATPCPLILAAPIAFISGMSRSARKGIIVKHGGVFESIEDASVFLFDKTGTLTFGIPELSDIIAYDTANKNDVLRIATSIEQYSTHILARSIVLKAKESGIEPIKASDVNETTGKGIRGTIDNSIYTIGKEKFLAQNNIVASEQVMNAVQASHRDGNILVHVAKDSQIIGSLVFKDNIRTNALDAISTIKSHHKDVVLMTGDSKTRGELVGHELGFDTIKTECLPEDKVKTVEEYENKGLKTVMIGDGVNDAPALARSSVGIALGHGSETASTDGADAVILVDDIAKINDLRDISSKTMYIAKQSIFVGMGLSVVAMFVAGAGYLPPVYGALFQEGVDVVVILNALRALKD